MDTCTDYRQTVGGRALLCPTGATPAPRFFASGSLLPGQPITVTGNVPLDVASVAAATTRPPRKLTIQASGLSFTIAGSGLTPWAATTIDLSGVRDVLGRTIGVDPLTTLVLTASLADGTFTMPPPPGAMLGAEPTIDGGFLRVGNRDSYDFILGIGATKGSRRLRLRHRFVCSASDYPKLQLDLVSETGTLVSLPTECGSKAVDAHVDLPAAERWALVVSGRRQDAIPGTFPGTAFPTAPYELDEVAFE